MRLPKLFAALSVLACAGCTTTLTPQDFSAGTPELQPLKFFQGHTHSWGVLETASGEPTQRFETDATGTLESDGTLHWPQRLTFADGTAQTRDWTLRRTGEHTYEGTANDVAGTAIGEAYGNLLHLTFTLETKPGNSLKNVTMEEWMVLEPDNTIVNRILIRKLGLTVAMGTEYFRQIGE